MWYLPEPEIEPMSPALAGRLTTGPLGKSQQFSSVAQSCTTLRPHGLQHARLPCPSPAPGACLNSCPSNQWCHPAISSCCPLLLLPSIFPSIRVFANESILHIRWPKYWSFGLSISPSNGYLELISFRIDWFDLLAVQGTLKSLLQHHSSKASVLGHTSFIDGPTLSSIHDYWKNHSFDYADLCRQSDVSAFSAYQWWSSNSFTGLCEFFCKITRPSPMGLWLPHFSYLTGSF